MKIKDCIKITAKMAKIRVKKMTSYNVVKHRLSNRFYNDDFLQTRLKERV